MTSEEYLKHTLCANCHITVMEAHPTLYEWIKCQLCGFCKKFNTLETEEQIKNSRMVINE